MPGRGFELCELEQELDARHSPRQAVEDLDGMRCVALLGRGARFERERGSVILDQIERTFRSRQSLLAVAATELDISELDPAPGTRLGIAGASGIERHSIELDRAVDVAVQPAQMSAALVASQIGPDVHRALEFAFSGVVVAELEQRVAEQEMTTGIVGLEIDHGLRQVARFAEAVLIL